MPSTPKSSLLYQAVQRLSAALSGSPKTFVARAGDLHRLTLAAYQEGGATLLQVLDATRTLSGRTNHVFPGRLRRAREFD